MKRLTISDMERSYGLWTIISGPHGAGKWLCRCEGCATEKVVRGSQLRNGTSTCCKSCGNKREELGFKFSHIEPETYRRVWYMVWRAYYRCADKDNLYYGGRNIEVKFNDKSEFIEYLLTINGHDDPNLVLDRIDVNGHYARGNIRFVTLSVSSYNRRPFTRRWAKRPSGGVT